MKSEITRKAVGLALVAAVVIGVPAAADEWDQAFDPDNGPSTDNVLFHGSEQVHDLGALAVPPFADHDWYLASIRPFSSYQFVVDGATGGLDLTSTDVQRLSGGGLVLESAVALEAGLVLTLNWLRSTAGPPETNFLRVQFASCGSACTSLDRYRARFYDTTYTVPRFNNSGTQTTVLVAQNATDRNCSVTFFFLDSAGSLLHATTPATVGPFAQVVLPTAGAVPGQSGTVRIAHTCGYGGLSGKAVSVEPATGFTFDTPVLHRPR